MGCDDGEKILAWSECLYLVWGGERGFGLVP